jgi:carbamoyl-phosphate synthase small subunit
MQRSMKPATAYLVLEDGTVFTGRSVGAAGVAAGEACFTTAMAGYQEAVTDPSYAAQVLCFSYPLVGNYGVAAERMESGRVWCEAVVMRRSRPAWSEWLREQGVVALEEVDTRALVRRIRDGGVLRCALGEAEPDELLARALAEPPIDGRRLDAGVGVQEPYAVGVGPRLTLLDFGTKRSIPRRLAAAGLEVLVVPGSWDADAVLETEPAAVLVSNGPGDPSVLTDEIETVRTLLGRVPLFGICLGHQLIGLALDHETFKLPFGHRGINHPVLERASGRVLVTSQNHGFAVRAKDERDTSHVSLYDDTVEGLTLPELRARSIQFHPEAGPGPHDAYSLIDAWVDELAEAH